MLVCRSSCEPTIGRPHPSDDDWVDNCRHHNRENEIAWKLDSLSHASTDNRCSGCAKGPLEEPINGVVCWCLIAVAVGLKKFMTE